MAYDYVDTKLRLEAFEHVRKLGETHDCLTAKELQPGFVFQGQRIPLINQQRGIFKPRQMRFLLSIRTVFPRPGAKVWYDDQREVHRQIFEGDEMVDYAFMGQNPDAADNRWLWEAFENRIPIIYFLGIAPGHYQAMLPAFISGWDAKALKARVAFGVPDQDALVPPEEVHRPCALASTVNEIAFPAMAAEGRSSNSTLPGERSISRTMESGSLAGDHAARTGDLRDGRPAWRCRHRTRQRSRVQPVQYPRHRRHRGIPAAGARSPASGTCCSWPRCRPCCCPWRFAAVSGSPERKVRSCLPPISPSWVGV